ncbi:hypothetical protein ACS5PU_20615 [Pedobacter sp. GSP4]|uniref:hypothetical protein n=1 Tax=Pedobacter sp. GSP4 TaxID=3453716 RepID=UPI003EEDED60
MKSKLLIACISISLLTACKPRNPNGIYIIYESTPYNPMFGGTSDFDQASSERLSEELQGKRYNLEFNEDYIILKLGEKNDMVLARKIERFSSERSDTTYNYNYTLDGQKTALSMAVSPNKDVPTANLMVTVNSRDGIVARVTCRLKKRNSN